MTTVDDYSRRRTGARRRAARLPRLARPAAAEDLLRARASADHGHHARHGLVLAGSMLYFTALESRLVLHEILIAVFMMLTTPVTYMLLGRAALHRDRRSGEDSRSIASGRVATSSRQRHGARGNGLLPTLSGWYSTCSSLRRRREPSGKSHSMDCPSDRPRSAVPTGASTDTLPFAASAWDG